MGLNRVDPLMQVFSIVNTTVLADLWSVELVDVELRVQRTDYKLYVDFPLCGRLAPLTPVLFKGQVYVESKFKKKSLLPEAGSCGWVKWVKGVKSYKLPIKK